MFTTVVTAVGIFAALLALSRPSVNTRRPKDSIERPVSAHQIVENAKSIIGQSGQQTEGTKQWRLNWWDIIINDTIYGPNFWTGRGFGINLAEADGFAGTEDRRHNRPPTRSPHNAHMTLLARAGVPGVVLWSLVLVSWFGMLMNAMLTARARRTRAMAGAVPVRRLLRDGDPHKRDVRRRARRPMQGIWFWCLFGFGIGSVMVYRAQYSDGMGAAAR